jgi:hypothetical protein
VVLSAARVREGSITLHTADQLIPAHDVVKIDLNDPIAGGLVVGESRRVYANLLLHLGKYEEIVEFELYRTGDRFHVQWRDLPMTWKPRRWRDRVRYEAQRRLP